MRHPPRSESMGTESSTITAGPVVATAAVTTTTATTTIASPLVLQEPLVIDIEEPPTLNLRDSSTSASSREGLKRQVERRRMTLTSPEMVFLDQLVIHGNEVEVQLAFDKLENDDLFFDWQTPRHLKSTSTVTSKEDEQQQSPTSPRPFLERALSVGSQRRLKILEERKHEKSALWQAHESGIAVTLNASKKSLLKRTSSWTTTASSHSLSSTTIGQPPADDNFRRRNSLRASAASPMRKARYQRSQSMILNSPPPSVPAPVKFSRRSSTSSRKSVTFHPGTPQQSRSNSKKQPRRSVSDSIATMLLDEASSQNKTIGRPPLPQRSDSTASIPSLHHGHPIRSDSISSVPSIHHGHPIRSDSIGSIPSIHHANALRSESAATARTSSIASIPSLHSAHPIHDRSSSFSSVPSLHHGNTVQSLFDDDSTADGNSRQRKVMVHKNSLIAENQPLFPAYSATPDIASAWLNQKQQGSKKFQSKPIDFESSSSFPPAITIPSTVTDETEGSTVEEGINDVKPFVVNQKAVLVRRASRNIYEGEGMEVTEMDENVRPTPMTNRIESVNMSIRACTSFDDETMSYYSHRQTNYDDIFRSSIRRTLSDEEVAAANILVGSSVNVLFRDVSNMTINRKGSEELDDSSWDMNSEVGDARFDSWNILKDEYVNGYGGGGTLDFNILGTCADDEAASPHVLSPPLMESLSGFLPYSKSGENFFLRYSLVRDGASMLTFLKRSRGVQHGILALETVDGEVFGCFTGQAWRKNWNYFGNGESFLWKMRRSRLAKTTDILDQAQLESEIDVYPYTGENKYIQLCTQDRIAVGGGTPNGENKTADPVPPVKSHEWGFGLAIQGDLLVGSSSPCVTFGSPGLSKVHSDGSLFEIVNLELWTLTPCATVEEAERLEVGKLFLQRD